jgi:hypothetical protein
MRCETMEWSHLAHDRSQLGAVENTIIELSCSVISSVAVLLLASEEGLTFAELFTRGLL